MSHESWVQLVVGRPSDVRRRQKGGDNDTAVRPRTSGERSGVRSRIGCSGVRPVVPRPDACGHAVLASLRFRKLIWLLVLRISEGPSLYQDIECHVSRAWCPLVLSV